MKTNTSEMNGELFSMRQVSLNQFSLDAKERRACLPDRVGRSMGAVVQTIETSLKKYMVVCLAAFAAAGCSEKKNAVSVAEAPAPLVRVTGVKAQHRFQERVFVQGTVRTRDSAVISARLPGAIDSMLVEEGASVKKGTALFQTDLVNLTNAVRAAQDDVSVATARLEQAVIVEKKAQQDAQRMERLVKGGAVTPDLEEKATVNALSATASVKAAKAVLTKATTGLEIARKNLADSTVKAPFDGIVTRKLKHTGDFAGAGTPVLMMDNTSAYEICFSLDASYYTRVAVGKTRIDNWVIAYKSPNVNPVTRTFEVRVTVEKDDALAPGMLKNGVLVLNEFTASGIPDSAVNLRDGHDTVFVVEKDTVVAVKLAPGVSCDGYRSIASGELGSGARVVSEGMLLLHAGDKVRVKED